MKKEFVIMTDAGGDYTPDIREKYDLEVQPKSTIVWPDGSERVADIAWEHITPNEYFTLMTNKKNNFASSVPAPGTIKDRLTEYAKNKQNVIVITISSTMSGGFSVFSVIAKEVMEENPGFKVAVIDSLRYGPAITLLAVEASRYRAAGHNFDETVAYLDEMRFHVHQMGTLDDLFFLARKGRISKGKAFMGNMVGIKPMADLNNETGLSEVIGKTRGYQKFYKVLPEYILKTIGNYKDKVFVIANSLREPQAEELTKIVKEKFNPEHLIVNPLGQTTGANVGPGLAAVFYMSDSRVSPHCEKERALLAELLLKK